MAQLFKGWITIRGKLTFGKFCSLFVLSQAWIRRLLCIAKLRTEIREEFDEFIEESGTKKPSAVPNVSTEAKKISIYLNMVVDADTRWRIHQSRPETLNDALMVASELEAFMETSQPRRQVCAVAVEESPDQESIVTAQFVDGEASEELGVIEVTGQFQERHNLMMGRSLIHINQNQVPLRTLNPTDSTETVSKDSIAGTCIPAQCINEESLLSVNCVKPHAADTEAPMETIPDHITDVYTEVARTTMRNSKMINTGDSLPIRQQARRLLLHKRQEARKEVLLGLPWKILLIYSDDVVVYMKTFEEMLTRLRTVLSRLRDAQLKLSPKKCSLFQSEVKYLGYVISFEGVSTDPVKVAAICDWPVPTNVTDLRSFLGLCSYYRCYVRGFADVAKPLYKLQQKAATYVWYEDCERSFARLKKCLTAALILSFPNVEEEFILDTDASDRGVGAVLSQMSGSEERLVAYFTTAMQMACQGGHVVSVESAQEKEAREESRDKDEGNQGTLRTCVGGASAATPVRNELDPPGKPKAGMKTYDVSAPFERIAVDTTGPLTESDRGKKYILVISDYFTKWTEAYTLPNQEAVTEVLNILGLDKTRTTPLRPQSDGMVERFNQTLKNMLSMFVKDNVSDWECHLPLLMMAYCSSVHETTGCSPSELMFGWEIRLPVDLMFGAPESEKDLKDTSAYAHSLQDKIPKVHSYAREHLAIESNQQKRKYNRQLNQKTYDQGASVWFYNPKKKKGVSPCFQLPWEGPYVVLKRISDVVYKIQRSPRSKARIIHHDRLSPYQGEEVPTWLDNKEVVQPISADIPSLEKAPDECRGGPEDLLMTGLACSEPSLKSASFKAVITMALRPLVLSNFSDNLSSLFILNILSVPGLILHLSSTAPDGLKPLKIHGIYKKAISFLQQEQSIRIVLNALECSYSLCLLANLVELFHIEIEVLKEDLISFVEVITKILNYCQSYVAKKQSNLTNWHPILDEALIPSSLKTALIIPLLKKSNLDTEDHDFKNFPRPVSNFPFVSKLIEKSVAVQLVQYIDDNNLDEKLQSTYKKLHSTETALLRVHDDILRTVDRDCTVVLLLLDLSTAFDTVDHGILLHRLNTRFGIKGKGSVLGPILYLLYTSPLGDIIRRPGMNFHFYADDYQVYFSLDSVSSVTTTRIEACLQDLGTWMSLNKLKLNGDNNELLVIGSGNLSASQLPSFTAIDGSVIQPSNYTRNIVKVRKIGRHLGSRPSLKRNGFSGLNISIPHIRKQLQSLWRQKVVNLLFEDLLVIGEGESSEGKSKDDKGIWKPWSRIGRGRSRSAQSSLSSPQVEVILKSCVMYQSVLCTFSQIKLDILTGLSYQEGFVVHLWKFFDSFCQNDSVESHLWSLEKTGLFNSCDLQAAFVLFCDCCSHLLPIVDDSEMYEIQKPFRLDELNRISAFLNNLVFKMLWNEMVEESRMQMLNSAHTLLMILYDRDCRRPFTSQDQWLVSGKSWVKGSLQLKSFQLVLFNILQRVQLFRKLVTQDKEELGITRPSNDFFPQGTLITVHRARLLEDGYEQLALLPTRSFKGIIRVRFINEQGLSEAGIDQDGVFKEFLEEVVKKGFDPSLGLFKMTSGEEERLFPSSTSFIHNNHLKLFEFLGKVLGKALYEGMVVEVPFASFFLNHILSRQHSSLYSSIDELPSLDQSLYKSLCFIKHYDGDVRDLELSFSFNEDVLGKVVTHQLMPGGNVMQVTNDNKISYVHLMAHYRMCVQIREQTLAFIRGFKSIVRHDWLQMFSGPELQRLISGDNAAMDLSDLRRVFMEFCYTHRCKSPVKLTIKAGLFWSHGFSTDNRDAWLRTEKKGADRHEKVVKSVHAHIQGSTPTFQPSSQVAGDNLDFITISVCLLAKLASGNRKPLAKTEILLVRG
ncbi:Ubiquitin-protein ligase E3B [Stylophora pistillata]|uniref:HECT-type E3 ubiquitin transferase n=1 Tax=Stylophora pistillata TaxID=50429 RepID=A0A2B4RGD8_STYPI|nr:Ubiquitin-protein ligase E3B [Stylophora pistillata]